MRLQSSSILKDDSIVVLHEVLNALNEYGGDFQNLTHFKLENYTIFNIINQIKGPEVPL